MASIMPCYNDLAIIGNLIRITSISISVDGLTPSEPLLVQFLPHHFPRNFSLLDSGTWLPSL